MRPLLRTALVLCLLAALPLFAEEPTGGPKIDAELKYIAATTLETQVQVNLGVAYPFLAGTGPLTAGNALRLELGASVSPVSCNGTLGARWTPLAPFQLYSGLSAGSGWNLPFADGLRLNEPETDGAGNPTGDADLSGGPLEGVVWSWESGGLFQFDLGAVAPGDWNHAVFQTYHALRWRAYTGAADGESWLYEADEGENRNGWNYYGVYFAGYRMPIALELVGVLAEENLRLYRTPGGASWGDRLPRWTVGPLLGWAFSPRLSAILLVQVRSARNFTDETEDLGFYQARRLKNETLDLEFYRAALTVSWRPALR